VIRARRLSKTRKFARWTARPPNCGLAIASLSPPAVFRRALDRRGSRGRHQSAGEYAVHLSGCWSEYRSYASRTSESRRQLEIESGSLRAHQRRIHRGITQPVISQRVIEHDIRLKEGEVSILGGLVQRSDSKTLEGWPGLARLPLLRYLFSHDKATTRKMKC